jgi:lysozyme family protein
MYPDDFVRAFNYAMLYEVGPFFKPSDPAVQQGLINTVSNRRACGYTNTPGDHGGETKFGIAKQANPSINIATLTLDKALNIYFNEYWLIGKCDKISSPLNILHFDTCVNMGVGAAAKLLQTSLGLIADGNIGPATLGAVLALPNSSLVCTKYLDSKQSRYDSIVAHNPSQAKFANGWKARTDDMRKFLGVK